MRLAAPRRGAAKDEVGLEWRRVDWDPCCSEAVGEVSGGESKRRAAQSAGRVASDAARILLDIASRSLWRDPTILPMGTADPLRGLHDGDVTLHPSSFAPASPFDCFTSHWLLAE